MKPVNWRKPLRSYSSGGCVEVAELADGRAVFRKSRRSMNNGNCPEAAAVPGGVAVRDTKQAGQSGRTVLAFTGEAWRAFTAALKGGAL